MLTLVQSDCNRQYLNAVDGVTDQCQLLCQMLRFGFHIVLEQNPTTNWDGQDSLETFYGVCQKSGDVHGPLTCIMWSVGSYYSMVVQLYPKQPNYPFHTMFLHKCRQISCQKWYQIAHWAIPECFCAVVGGIALLGSSIREGCCHEGVCVVCNSV